MSKKRIQIVNDEVIEADGVEVRTSKNVLAEIHGSFGVWTDRGEEKLVHLKTGMIVRPPNEVTVRTMLSVLLRQEKFVALLDQLAFGQKAPVKLNTLYLTLCKRVADLQKASAT